jgi:hypothetical protein
MRMIFNTPTAEKDSTKFCCGCFFTISFFELWGTNVVELETAG